MSLSSDEHRMFDSNLPVVRESLSLRPTTAIAQLALEEIKEETFTRLNSFELMSFQTPALTVHTQVTEPS